MTGVPKLNPLTSKAISIHPGGHVCEPSATEGDSLARAARAGWVSKKLLFHATVHRQLKAVLSPLRILAFSLFLLLLGSESRVGWQEGRMSPHSFYLLWAQ